MNSELIDLYDTDTTEPGPFPKLGKRFFAALLAIAVGAGWSLRDQQYIEPEQGFGYWLGVLGVSLILCSLPLGFLGSGPSNRRQTLASVLCVSASVLLLFHANFHWGVFTSTWVLASVLLVTASTKVGLAVNRDLFPLSANRPIDLSMLQSTLTKSRSAMTQALEISPVLTKYLEQTEELELAGASSLVGRYRRLHGLDERMNQVQQRSMKFLRDVLEAQAQDEGWSPEQLQERLSVVGGRVRAYLRNMAGLARFRVRRQLAVIWRAVHILLILSLTGAVVIHLFSVHAY